MAGEGSSLLATILKNGAFPTIGIGFIAPLVLDPSVSLNPDYPLIILLGIVALVVTFLQFVNRDQSLNSNHRQYFGVYQFAGLAASCYVIVDWAKYESSTSALIAFVAILAGLGIATRWSRRTIASKYPKPVRRLVYIGIAGSILFSALALPLVNPAESGTPLVVVSPFPGDLQTTRPVPVQSLNLTVAVFRADAYNITITSNSTKLLPSYIGGLEGGPKVLNFLQNGQRDTIPAQIQTSVRLANGTYDIRLNYSYQDVRGSTYHGSKDFSVIVGPARSSLGGGVPEIPFQPLALTILTGFIIVSYLLIRSRLGRVGIPGGGAMNPMCGQISRPTLLFHCSWM